MLQDILPRPVHTTEKNSRQSFYSYKQGNTKPQCWRVNEMTTKNCILKLEPPSNSVQNKFPKLRFPKGIGLKVQRDICFQVCYHKVWKGGSVGSCQQNREQLPHALPKECGQGQYFTHLLLPSLTACLWAICSSPSNPSMELEQQHLSPSAIPRNNLLMSACWLTL